MNNDEQKKKDTEAFEAEIQKTAAALPTHKYKEFNFSGLERQLLAEQATIVSLAQMTSDKVINEVILRRVGIEPNHEIFVNYSVGLGKMVVFIPREEKTKKK